EAEGKLRGHLMKEGWGWQKIEQIRARGQDLTPRMVFERPDDGRELDFTVVSVALDKPVAPGETLEVELRWSAQLPRVRRRTGYKDDFMLVAHWFPKLGVYEEGRGWNCHQFHANTEFYADYGTYDVTLDLPIEYATKVGASGVAYGPPTMQGDRVRTRFLAPSREDRGRTDASGRAPLVHGFAWTADPDYSVHVSTFQYDEWAERFEAEVQATASSLGVDKDAIRLRNVTVEVMMQPERAEQWKRHFDATCAALFFYGLWFGEYPYEKITVVDPAWGGGAAGGMEYPTLFTCGTKLFTEPRMYRPESVTVHEAGHQFWYGLVGNNEFENAWLDEGLNSYTDSEVLYRTYGTRRDATWYSGLPVWGVPAADLPGGSGIGDVLSGRSLSLPGSPTFRPLKASAFIDWWRDQPRLTFVEQTSDPRWQDRGSYLRSPDRDPIITGGSWKYLDRRSYGCNSYARPAVVLRSLAAVVGRDAFMRGMRTYADRWRYRHPYPQDFFDAFNEGADVDVSWYFDDLFRTTATVDWSVDVKQRRTPHERGFFLDDDGHWILREDVPDEDVPGIVLAGQDGMVESHEDDVAPPDGPVESDQDSTPADDDSSADDSHAAPDESARVEAPDEESSGDADSAGAGDEPSELAADSTDADDAPVQGDSEQAAEDPAAVITESDASGNAPATSAEAQQLPAADAQNPNSEQTRADDPVPDAAGSKALDTQLEQPSDGEQQPEAGKGIGGPGPEDEEQDPADADDAESRPWLYDIVIRSGGGLRLPVTIEVTFEKGDRERYEWTREAQLNSNWWRLPVESRTEKVQSVIVDPDRLYYLDENMSDNQWFEEVDHTTPLRWGERILTQYSQLFHWYSSIGG
ncbi:MAG: hypothetical protein ACI841_002214, partial [Planctomycetota bacterium]